MMQRVAVLNEKTSARDMTDAINLLADEINVTLNTNRTEKYFESVILLYSFVENLLVWLLYINTLWEIYSKPVKISSKDMEDAERFFQRLSFYNSIWMALSTKLIDISLWRRIDKLRRERNSIVHQLWLYEHRGDTSQLRKKLEELAGVANDLVGIFKRLTKKIGVDEVYRIILRR